MEGCVKICMQGWVKGWEEWWVEGCVKICMQGWVKGWEEWWVEGRVKICIGVGGSGERVSWSPADKPIHTAWARRKKRPIAALYV